MTIEANSLQQCAMEYFAASYSTAWVNSAIIGL